MKNLFRRLFSQKIHSAKESVGQKEEELGTEVTDEGGDDAKEKKDGHTTAGASRNNCITIEEDEVESKPPMQDAPTLSLTPLGALPDQHDAASFIAPIDEVGAEVEEVKSEEHKEIFAPVISPAPFPAEWQVDTGTGEYDPHTTIYSPVVGPVSGRWPAHYPKNTLIGVKLASHNGEWFLEPVEKEKISPSPVSTASPSSAPQDDYSTIFDPALVDSLMVIWKNAFDGSSTSEASLPAPMQLHQGTMLGGDMVKGEGKNGKQEWFCLLPPAGQGEVLHAGDRITFMLWELFFSASSPQSPHHCRQTFAIHCKKLGVTGSHHAALDSERSRSSSASMDSATEEEGEEERVEKKLEANEIDRKNEDIERDEEKHGVVGSAGKRRPAEKKQNSEEEEEEFEEARGEGQRRLSYSHVTPKQQQKDNDSLAASAGMMVDLSSDAVDSMIRRSLWVLNLSPTVTSASRLREACEQFAPVTKARLQTKTSRNPSSATNSTTYGFVMMADERAAEACLAGINDPERNPLPLYEVNGWWSFSYAEPATSLTKPPALKKSRLPGRKQQQMNGGGGGGGEEEGDGAVLEETAATKEKDYANGGVIIQPHGQQTIIEDEVEGNGHLLENTMSDNNSPASNADGNHGQDNNLSYHQWIPPDLGSLLLDGANSEQPTTTETKAHDISDPFAEDGGEEEEDEEGEEEGAVDDYISIITVLIAETVFPPPPPTASTGANHKQRQQQENFDEYTFPLYVRVVSPQLPLHNPCSTLATKHATGAAETTNSPAASGVEFWMSGDDFCESPAPPRVGEWYEVQVMRESITPPNKVGATTTAGDAGLEQQQQQHEQENEGEGEGAWEGDMFLQALDPPKQVEALPGVLDSRAGHSKDGGMIELLLEVVVGARTREGFLHCYTEAFPRWVVDYNGLLRGEQQGGKARVWVAERRHPHSTIPGGKWKVVGVVGAAGQEENGRTTTLTRPLYLATIGMKKGEVREGALSGHRGEGEESGRARFRTDLVGLVCCRSPDRRYFIVYCRELEGANAVIEAKNEDDEITTSTTSEERTKNPLGQWVRFDAIRHYGLDYWVVADWTVTKLEEGGPRILPANRYNSVLMECDLQPWAMDKLEEAASITMCAFGYQAGGGITTNNKLRELAPNIYWSEWVDVIRDSQGCMSRNPRARHNSFTALHHSSPPSQKAAIAARMVDWQHVDIPVEWLIVHRME